MNHEMPKCELCPNEAAEEVVWGLYEDHNGIPRTTPMQNADLCSDCSTGLWDEIKGAVNQGIMHFAIKQGYKIDKLRAEILTNINSNQTT